MPVFYLLILGAALTVIISYHKRKNPAPDQRQQILWAALGSQLRQEFSNYDHELTEDATRVIAVILANSFFKIFELEQDIKLAKSNLINRSRKIEILKGNIRQAYVDMRKKILTASPPLMKKYL